MVQEEGPGEKPDMELIVMVVNLLCQLQHIM